MNRVQFSFRCMVLISTEAPALPTLTRNIHSLIRMRVVSARSWSDAHGFSFDAFLFSRCLRCRSFSGPVAGNRVLRVARRPRSGEAECEILVWITFRPAAARD